MSDEKPSLAALRIDRSRAPQRGSKGWLWAVLLLLAGGGGYAWWRMAGNAVTVRTALAESVKLDGGSSARTLLNASGYVTARRAATVSSKVTGKVIEVLVEEGMRVKAGQELARLDASNIEAGLALARAQLDSTRKGLAETTPDLTFARQELERFVTLEKTKATSQSDIRRAEASVASLEARQLRLAADVTVAEREVAQWEQQLEDMVIRSPFDGVVTTKDSQPGEMISPMSSGGFTRTGICTVVDMSSLEIDVDVSESYINRVTADQPAEATLDAYPEWKIPAKVIAIIPTADRQKATVKVRVGFVSPDPRILPEMGVKVAFQSEPGAQPAAAANNRGVSIPEDAVADSGGNPIVWVVRGKKVERRAVTVTQTTGGKAIVAAGLAAGEAVVLTPPATLTDGTAIRISDP